MSAVITETVEFAEDVTIASWFEADHGSRLVFRLVHCFLGFLLNLHNLEDIVLPKYGSFDADKTTLNSKTFQ